MKEFIINLFIGAACGAGIVLIVEETIGMILSFIDCIEAFKEKWGKKDESKDN